jgi:hypothetical protein
MGTGGKQQVYLLAHALQQKSNLCIPRKDIARPQSQFPRLLFWEYLFLIFGIVSLQCGGWEGVMLAGGDCEGKWKEVVLQYRTPIKAEITLTQ